MRRRRRSRIARTENVDKGKEGVNPRAGEGEKVENEKEEKEEVETEKEWEWEVERE